MRDFYIIAAVGGVAVVLGTALFFFGPASLQADVRAALALRSPQITPTVLAQGDRASQVSERVNYRITTAAQFADLWKLAYGPDNTPDLPAVDFTKSEVLAVFDGTHAQNGYSIQVTRVRDENGTRSIVITHIRPDSSCTPKTGFTSPFEIIMVPKTSSTLAHTDVTSATPCN